MNNEILKLNSVQENELLMVGCIEKQQLEKVCMLLDNGARLTPFVLTNLSLKDYGKDSIISVLMHTNNFDPNIFIWLKNYFTVEELVDVFNHFYNQLPADYPSDDDCIRLKLWNVLSCRFKWDLVAENAPETIEKMLDKKPYLIDHLLKVDLEKYGERALNERRYIAILVSNKDGWRYLFEHGKEDIVFQQMIVDYENLPMDEIMAYCREKQWIERIYKKEAYRALLKCGEFSIFIKNHNLGTDFLLGYPNKVDWEDLWDYYHKDETYRSHIIWAANLNKHVPECADFLKKHTGLRGFFNKFV